MSTDMPDLARAILHTLLDRHEQPDRHTVVRARLNEQHHADYFSQTDGGPRQATNAVLQQLAAQGLVQLHWRKWEQSNWLTAVDLLPSGADALYALLRRSPRTRQEAALRALLHAHAPHTGWQAALLAWAEQQLAQHRSVAPLLLDKPQWNADLLRALDAIAQLRSLTSERALSVRLFANSKRIAELRSAIVAVLRRHAPDAAQFGDDDRALLQAHLLQRIPEYVPLAGPLVLQWAAAEAAPTLIDMRGLPQGLALPTAVLQTCKVQHCAARVVVTVENATSFHELLALRPPEMLVLSTGGFTSPAALALLHTLRTAQPACALYHWGDLDPGGLRILAHLRSSLGDVRPLAMDAATFAQYRQHAQRLTTRDRAALKHLLRHPLLADCVPLIEHLLAADSKLEQEAVVPPHIGEHVDSDTP